MAEISGQALGPDEAAAAISARVHDHVTYLPGATGVRTNAQEAWDKGQGVCQDMAQIAVSLLRAAGLPARYVSGYLHPDPKARARQHVDRPVARLGRVLGRLVDRARPHQRRPGRRAPRRRRPRPRLRRRPAAQGHLPRPARQRHAGHGRGHPPRLRPDQDQTRLIERSRGSASRAPLILPPRPAAKSRRAPLRWKRRPRPPALSRSAAHAGSGDEDKGHRLARFPGSSARDVLARCVGPGRRDTQ